MSRQHDEENTGRRNPKKNNRSSSGGTNFVSFHPTKEEKQAIKELQSSDLMVSATVANLVDRGLTLKLVLNQAGNAYCAVISEAGKPFNEGTCLACFHANMETLFAMVQYMLAVKYPDFPEQPPDNRQYEFDW